MTEQRLHPTASEPPPGLSIDAEIQVGAGGSTTLHLTVTNHAAEPRLMLLTGIGLDAEWLPAPVRTRSILPGGRLQVELPVHATAGAVPARYPFTIVTQAIHPVTGKATSATVLAESTLVVSGPVQLSIRLTPSVSSAVIGQRLAVLLHNSGTTPTTVDLETRTPTSTFLRFRPRSVAVPAGETRKVRGRIRVARPRLFGSSSRHAFTVTARGTGAPRQAQGSFTARPLFGPMATKIVAIVAVVAVWAALAIVFIPRIATSVQQRQEAKTAAAAPSGDVSDEDSTGQGTDGSGPTGPGKKAEQAKHGDDQAVQLNGVVSSSQPAGVRVSLAPTSLVDEGVGQAQPVGFDSSALKEVGMVTAAAAYVETGPVRDQHRSLITRQDGAWSFPGVHAPGYYLLTFAKPGYQTQSYVIDSSSADSTEPLKVALVAGQGRLTGTVRGPSGPVGGATVTLTDGTSTVTTSTNTRHGVGNWSVDGLSTPSSYLVSATKSGLSIASRLVPLAAAGSSRVDLRLVAGVGSLTGLVTGQDGAGRSAGLGGAQVTVTDGDITRTASTVTSGPVGRFTLSGLPVPGDYTVTFSAAGHRSQVTKVHFEAGRSAVTRNVALTPDAAVISGTITGAGADGAGLVGAGLILSNKDQTYKTMTTSQPAGGFRFSGVASGTYVLSSQMFGYATDYVTVVATAGETTSVHRVLATQTAGILPSTSHVQGEVVDARTGTVITCPTDQPKCITVAVAGPGPEGDSGDPSTHTTTILPTERYLLPSTESGEGLLPGVYKIKVTAVGYEAAHATVEVPLDSLFTAPTISLSPNPVITGRVTPVVGTPATATCVWAITAGGASESATANSSGPPPCTPPTCKAATGSTSGEPSCAVVDPVSGYYSMPVPGHGTYTVHVVPSDPEYPPVAGVNFTVGVGGTQVYDAFLHRLGRVDVFVLEPSPTGILRAAEGAVVTLTGSTKTYTTDPSGRALITAIKGGSHDAQASKTTEGVTTTTQPIKLAVADDQTIPVTLALTNPIGSVIGRLVTNVDGNATGVPNAHVTLTGIREYRDDTPVYGTVELTSDSDGCFAVYDADHPIAESVSPCWEIGSGGATAAAASTKEFTLLSNVVSLTVDAPGTEPLVLSGQRVATGGVNTFALQPLPVDFSGTLGVDPPLSYYDDPVDLSKATIKVTSAAVGTGTLSVSASANGNLTWNDNHYASSNKIRPGTYRLTATLEGYAPATVDFTCAVATPCVVPKFELLKLTSLTVSALTAGAGGTTGDGPAAVNGARFTLTDTGTNPQAPITLTASGNSVTFTGLNPEHDGYRVTVQAAGYQFPTGASAVACGGAAASPDIPAATPGADLTCTAELARAGAITGQVSGKVGTSTAPLAGATIKATQCTTANVCTTFTTTSNSEGTYRITGTNDVQGLDIGTWNTSASSPGYTNTEAEVIVDSFADVTQNLVLDMTPVKYTVTVRDSKGKAVAGLSVSLLDGPSAPTALAADTQSANTYTFTAVLPGTYTLQASGGKINTQTVQVIILPGVAAQTYPLTVSPGVNLSTGMVLGLQGAGTSPAPLAGATVCLVEAAGPASCAVPATGTDDKPLTITTGADGKFTFRNVPDGSFYVVAEKEHGYIGAISPTPTVYNHGSAAAPPASITLDRVTHNVTVTINAPNGDDLSGVKATLSPAGGMANPTYSQLSLIGQGADGRSAPFTFTQQLPFGCWQLTLRSPTFTDHTGTLSASGGGTGCPAGAPGDSFGVPDTGSDPVAVTYTLDEQALMIMTDLTWLTPDAYGLRSDNTTVQIVVSQGETDVSTVTLPISSTQPYLLWLKPGVYTVTGTPSTGAWLATGTEHDVSLPGGAGSISKLLKFAEAAASVSVTTTGATTAKPQRISLTFDLNGKPATGFPKDVTTDSALEVADLPPGKWTITATSSAGSASKTITLGIGANSVLIPAPGSTETPTPTTSPSSEATQ